MSARCRVGASMEAGTLTLAKFDAICAESMPHLPADVRIKDFIGVLRAALAASPAPDDYNPPDYSLGCACKCCDHSEGSECACDCHSEGLCAGREVAVTYDKHGMFVAAASPAPALVADGKKLLARLIGQCEQRSDHDWHKCKRCILVEELGHHGDSLAKRALSALLTEPASPVTHVLGGDVEAALKEHVGKLVAEKSPAFERNGIRTGERVVIAGVGIVGTVTHCTEEGVTVEWDNGQRGDLAWRPDTAYNAYRLQVVCRIKD